MALTDSKFYTCPHCGKNVELDRYSKVCSNCFGCVGCEQYVCSNCNELIIIEPPAHMKKKDKM